MRMCVGAIVRLLYWCAGENAYKNKIITSLVYAVDPTAVVEYVSNPDTDRGQFPLKNPEQGKTYYKIEAMEVTRIFGCKDSINPREEDEVKHFSNIYEVAKTVDLETVKQGFYKQFIYNNRIPADNREKLIISLLDVVERDTNIDVKYPRGFEQFLSKSRKGLLERVESETLDLSDLLARLFLFSAVCVSSEHGRLDCGLGDSEDDSFKRIGNKKNSIKFKDISTNSDNTPDFKPPPYGVDADTNIYRNAEVLESKQTFVGQANMGLPSVINNIHVTGDKPTVIPNVETLTINNY